MLSQKTPVSISVGVVLDLQALEGRISQTSLYLALEDFYVSHANYSSRLQLLFRDSKKDIIVAASEGKEVAPVKFKGSGPWFLPLSWKNNLKICLNAVDLLSFLNCYVFCC